MNYFLLIFLGLLLPGDIPKYASFGAILFLVRFTDYIRWLWLLLILLATTTVSYEPIVSFQMSLRLILALALGSMLAREYPKGLSILMYRIGFFYILCPLLIIAVMGVGPLEQIFNKVYTRSIFESNIRYCGIFGNPNHLSLVAVGVIPILLKKVIDDKSYFAFITLVSCMVSLYLSASRAGIVISLLQILFLFLSRNVVKKVSQILFLLPILFLLSFWFFQPVMERTETLSVDSMTENRIERWTLGIGSIKRNLVFGQGLGVGGVNNSGDLQQSYSTGYMLHNSYLAIVQELGIFMGLIVFWKLLLKPLMISRRVDMACFISFTGLLLHGISESFMLYAANPGSFLLLLLVNFILYNATDYQ